MNSSLKAIVTGNRWNPGQRRQNHRDASAKRTLLLPFPPVLGALACTANLSLRADWGDDCLGYTVTARRAE